MNTVIWKYDLDIIGGLQVVEMPQGAELLAVQEQGGYPCMWVSVDPVKPAEQRMFRVYGTGHPFVPDEVSVYRGTVQAQGVYVWHVYEVFAYPPKED